jgi:hypothetical protein
MWNCRAPIWIFERSIASLFTESLPLSGL